jgi:hypothetical protein
MPLWQRHMNAFLPQSCGFALGDDSIACDERDVQTPSSNGSDMLVATSVPDVDRDLGVSRRIATHDLAQETARKGSENSDSDDANLYSTGRACSSRRQFKLLDRWNSIAQETPSGVSQVCSSMASLEQRDAKLILEVADRPANTRLLYMERFSSPPETPALGSSNHVT